MRTALEIAQAVASSVGFDQVTSLSNARDPEVRQMLALFNRGCSLLAAMRGPFSESWPVLVREASFDTVEGQESYALPTDFVSFIPRTPWDRTQHEPMRGPLTPGQWSLSRNSQIGTVAFTSRYRLRLSTDTHLVQVALDPIPGGVNEVVYEYISSFWVRASATAPISASRVTQDSQVPAFPDTLVELDLEWRLRQANGLAFAANIAEFEQERDRLFVNEVGRKDIDMAGERFDALALDPVVPANFDIS